MEERLELQSKETYSQIRNAVITAQSKVAVAVNTAMIHCIMIGYWRARTKK